MYYLHEGTEQFEKPPVNLVWPEMSTNGFDMSEMKEYLSERNLSFELAEANGWYPSRHAGDCFLRIVIPARVMKYKQVYWQARAVSLNAFVRYRSPKGPREGALIYVSAEPPCEHDPEPTKRVVVVEGPMDALAAAACGYDAIALMGINPGVLALDHLKRLVRKRDTLVLLDSEPEATKAAYDVCMILASTGTNAMCATLDRKKDLASCSLAYRKEFLDDRLGEI